MVFSSLTFICVFLPVVFALHCLIPSMRVRNVLLIVASLAFYSYGEPVLVVLMVISTLVNWGLGLLVGPRPGGRGPSKAMLALAVIVNLGFLCVFKYADMLVGSINALAGTSLPLPQIALPIGISFYTFQALSYVIDVYRGEATAQRNYLRVLLYISFFPQLIAGPIIKYHDVAGQIMHRRVTVEGVALGFRRFCVGLGKKVLIANTMAVAVDGIFGATLSSVNITAAWIAAIAYLLQIYFDFSGYSDMAIGMARMFGFEYKENFDHPYASSSVKMFWRRWHISLSTWFKEYVYIPLGGNRHGRPRAVLNKTIVFFLCGLWHGAAWTFVVWGLIHGIFLLIEEYIPIKRLPKPIGIIYTLLVVTVAFVLFRADTFAQGGFFIAQMFTGFHFDYASIELTMRYLSPLFVAMLPVAAIAASPVAVNVKSRLAASSAGAQATARTVSYVLALVLLVVCLLALSTGGYNPFIYFRF